MQNRVLLVEDDEELRELLSRYLTNQGFTVREAANGQDGLSLALGQHCDLVVLDIMLPDISGLEVLRQLRAKTHLPVVLLTARGDETDRIVGFEVGADDYIPKPCNPRELIARLQALLRRVAWDQEVGTDESRAYGDLRVEPVHRRIYQNDVRGTGSDRYGIRSVAGTAGPRRQCGTQDGSYAVGSGPSAGSL